MTEEGYQCWFCGDGIDPSDRSAILISVTGLQDWRAGRTDGPSQALFSHSHCAENALAGATMEFDPEMFAED
jgi:hypothetical protein